MRTTKTILSMLLTKYASRLARHSPDSPRGRDVGGFTRYVLLSICFLAISARSGDITTGNLTVTNDATIHGQLNFGFAGLTNGALAIGGTITTSGLYRIHTFTNVGTDEFIVLGGPLVCDVLVVAGGGAGVYNAGGGGGGGGLISTNYSIPVGPTVVIIGAGGLAIAGNTPGQNGGNSVFGSLTAIGGGGGGANVGSGAGLMGRDGGSGGGGAASGSHTSYGGTGTDLQGFDGGGNGGYISNFYPSGGGGGAGSAGITAPSSFAGGNGGSGITNSFSGDAVGYAGGGGGGTYSNSGTAGIGIDGGGNGATGGGVGSAGKPNTGGGGGCGGGLRIGGSGGSGIVIVRYLIGQAASSNIITLTLSSNGISQVSTSAVNSFMGKVGIGTESPEEKLHVSENVRIDGSLTFGNETRTNWPSGGGVAEGALMVSSNLADLADAAAARTNLGLGTAATNDASAFDAAGEAAAVGSDLTTHTGDFNNPHKVTAAQVGALSVVNNLSDVGNVATVRDNLGLGSAATRNAEDFLTPTGDGSQLTGITAAQVAGTLISSNNLSDVADVTTARNNLGALSAAGGVVNGSLDLTGSIAAGVPGGDIPMGVYTNQ